VLAAVVDDVVLSRCRVVGDEATDMTSPTARVRESVNERPAALYMWSHVHLGQGAWT